MDRRDGRCVDRRRRDRRSRGTDWRRRYPPSSNGGSWRRCVGDEARELEAQLRRYAVPLEPAFRKAIVDGPPPAELREARAAAEARFDARQKFPIQDYSVEGVSEKDLAAFRRVSRQAYVDDQVRRFATGYRANAVAGLGIIGGPGARQVLARLAANKNDPLALAAREAIKVADQR